MLATDAMHHKTQCCLFVALTANITALTANITLHNVCNGMYSCINEQGLPPSYSVDEKGPVRSLHFVSCRCRVAECLESPLAGMCMRDSPWTTG